MTIARLRVLLPAVLVLLTAATWSVAHAQRPPIKIGFTTDLTGKVPSYFAETNYTSGRWINDAVKAQNVYIRKIERKDVYSRDFPPCKAC